MRKDLSMSKGKMIAQGAHGSLGVFFNRITEIDKEDGKMVIKFDPAEYEWITGPFTKIALGVKSEEELVELFEKVHTLEVPSVLITDKKLSERDEKPVHTCFCVGPCEEGIVAPILGHLKPMQVDMNKLRNVILFDESAAEFVCEALGIEGIDPKDLVAVQKDKIVTKQDGLLALIDLEIEGEENGN